MARMYFTIAGVNHYFGSDFMRPGMPVGLIKEPDNEHDREAIRVEMEGLGKVGYVANSPYTVLGESMSAGRLYDRIGDVTIGFVMYVLGKGVLCAIDDGQDDAAAPKDAGQDAHRQESGGPTGRRIGFDGGGAAPDIPVPTCASPEAVSVHG